MIVVGQRCQAVWKEEGLKLGALFRAQPGDGGEEAHDGLNKQRDVVEGGDG